MKLWHTFVITAVAILFIVLINAADAADHRFDRNYFDEPTSSYEVYPTLPGTDIRDYSEPGLVIERYHDGTEVGYPTLPGTAIPNYSQPGYRIERR